MLFCQPTLIWQVSNPSTLFVMGNWDTLTISNFINYVRQQTYLTALIFFMCTLQARILLFNGYCWSWWLSFCIIFFPFIELCLIFCLYFFYYFGLYGVGFVHFWRPNDDEQMLNSIQLLWIVVSLKVKPHLNYFMQLQNKLLNKSC